LCTLHLIPVRKSLIPKVYKALLFCDSMKYLTLLIIAIIVIAGVSVTSVAIYEYQNEPIVEPVITPIIESIIDPIIKETIQNKTDEGFEPSPKITNSNFQIMKQKYDDFLDRYNALVLSQRSVIPYPINYSYVTAEGFTDESKGIEWCGIVDSHEGNVSSLLGELNSSLEQLEAIENKTPQIIELVVEKYQVLSNVITKEVKNLKFKFNQVDCDDVLGDNPRINYATPELE